MHQIHKAYDKKCIDTKLSIHIALLQIRSTPLGPGLPSPAMLLFNHPIQGILPIVNRLPINTNNEDEHYDMLVNRQTKNDKNNITFRNYASFSIGSTVAVHCRYGGPWTHGKDVGRGDHNHNNRSCIICISKTGQIVIRNRKHITATHTQQQNNTSEIN